MRPSNASPSHSTVKLNRDLVEEARREAELFSRSLGGQIEHWARLGRAVENLPGLSQGAIRRCLAGELPIESLSEREQEVLFDSLAGAFRDPPASVRDGYAALGARPGAVGDVP